MRKFVSLLVFWSLLGSPAWSDSYAFGEAQNDYDNFYIDLDNTSKFSLNFSDIYQNVTTFQFLNFDFKGALDCALNCVTPKFQYLPSDLDFFLPNLKDESSEISPFQEGLIWNPSFQYYQAGEGEQLNKSLNIGVSIALSF